MSDSYIVPQSVRAAAKRGLELRRKHGRGGLDTRQAREEGVGSGVQRASNLVQGRVTLDTIKRMASFFARHRKNKDSREANGEPGAGMIAWLLWGGDPGDRWSRRILRELAAKKSLDQVELLLSKVLGEATVEELVSAELHKSVIQGISQVVLGFIVEDGAEEEEQPFPWFIVEDSAEEQLGNWEELQKADGPKVPAKYLEGLEGEARERRKREIQDRMRREGGNKDFSELPGDSDAKDDTKPSKYSRKQIAEKIREELKGDNTKANFLRAAAKVSGVSKKILEQVYDRGMAAWGAGHRPGASQVAWAIARVYSFLSRDGKTRRTADKDLWAEHLKNKN